MPLTDKVAAARRIEALLKDVIHQGGLKLKYRISIDPPNTDQRDWERPEILVELAGPDSPLLLERGAELLRSIEYLALESLRLRPDEHDKVTFDSMGYRSSRLQELKMAAQVAADKVRESQMPYAFAPMSSRERRIVHLALRDESDLRTESAGEAALRHVVVYPKDYQGKPPAPRFSRRR